VNMSAGVVVPFIGPERWGGGRPGSDGGGGALSKWWPVMEGEARGMAPSDEGKWRRRDTGLVQLLTRGGERPSAAHGAAAVNKGGDGLGVRRWKTPPSWAELLGRKAMIGPAGMLG
jgi:hypothetical protein